MLQNSAQSPAIALALCLVYSATALAQAPTRIKAKGTVVSAVAGQIIMTAADGKTYTVKIRPEQNIVKVEGKLTPDKLQTGMIVRFEGQLKGTSLDGEISQLKIYTAADGFEPGVLQDDPAQPATVTGILTKVAKDVLTVSAGRRRIIGKLAADAAILVETKDYSLAKSGDPIEVDGTLVKDGSSLTARSVVITLGGKPAEDAKTTAKAKKKVK